MRRFVEPVRLQEVAVNHDVTGVEQMAQRAASITQCAPNLQWCVDHVIPPQWIRHWKVVHDIDDPSAIELQPVAPIAKADKYFYIGPAACRVERGVTVHTLLKSLHEFETRKLHQTFPLYC